MANCHETSFIGLRHGKLPGVENFTREPVANCQSFTGSFGMQWQFAKGPPDIFSLNGKLPSRVGRFWLITARCQIMNISSGMLWQFATPRRTPYRIFARVP